MQRLDKHAILTTTMINNTNTQVISINETTPSTASSQQIEGFRSHNCCRSEIERCAVEQRPEMKSNKLTDSRREYNKGNEYIRNLEKTKKYAEEEKNVNAVCMVGDYLLLLHSKLLQLP